MKNNINQINYSDISTEILEVLKNTSEDITARIPSEIFNILNQSSNKDYFCELDLKKPLSEQNLLPETFDILAGIYIKYCSNDEEKRDFYYREIKKNEIAKEKYYNKNSIKNYDEIFSNRKKLVVEEENKESKLAVYNEKKERKIKNIINKILCFFRGKKNGK